MSSSWIVKTTQMSEAGKEIILREALATHMRSSRDRMILRRTVKDKYLLKDLIPLYAAFYLHSYQGVRLHSIASTEDVPMEEKDAYDMEDRDLIEDEVKQLLGDKQSEEVVVSKLLSEFIVKFSDEIGSTGATDEVRERTIEMIKGFLRRIPTEYSPNHDADFIAGITGWAKTWSSELYTKASGLKETSLSLRDELMKLHEQEIVEISVLKRTLDNILGHTEFLRGRYIDYPIPDEIWYDIADSTIKNLSGSPGEIAAQKKAHEYKIALYEKLISLLDTPLTAEEYESEMGSFAAERLGIIIEENPRLTFEILACFFGIDSQDVKASLRPKGLTDPETIGKGLLTAKPVETAEETERLEEVQFSKEELVDLERSLKRIDKIEKKLEGPVKGMLKARGLRASELDKFTIETLTKDRDSLLGIELQVLAALKEKVRLPPPEEIKRLLEARELVEKGALKSMGMMSADDMTQQRRHGEALKSLKLDIVWHFTFGVFKNIARILETYIRSKQDLLRTKALLKSIYESPGTEFQALREEILIDLASDRIYEMKIAHPELDARTISSWMHARFANKDVKTARETLESTPSPVFQGISDMALHVEKLEFDNYSIAYDVMQRFLRHERKKKVAKEELAIEAELEEQRIAESKRKKLDVLMFIYTKAHTVFRAIGRVGTKGLEWGPNDDAKCANLLGFFVKMNRGRPVCKVCGSTPKEGSCDRHGKGNMSESKDLDNLSVFVMRSISDIKEGLIGPTSEPISWDKARSIVRREISILRRRGKLTTKTDINNLMPGEINYVIGPAIAKVIGKYFNESLEYAARRVDLA